MFYLKNLRCFLIVVLLTKLSLADPIVEFGYHSRGRGLTAGTHYAYEDLQVNFYIFQGNLLSCKAFKIVDNQQVELEYPEQYFKRLDKLYKLQEPLRKQKKKEEEDRIKDEEFQKEQERQRKFQEDLPKDIKKIDDAINQFKTNEQKVDCCTTM